MTDKRMDGFLIIESPTWPAAEQMPFSSEESLIRDGFVGQQMSLPRALLGRSMPLSENRGSSLAKPSSSDSGHAWAVLLAGGDGTRLQSLTHKIAGDSRPKQFCSILGDASLFSQTRQRLRPLFHSDRNVFVVTRAHEPFYKDEIQRADDSNIIAQPWNRGTGVAITVALLHSLRCDPDALGGFFPCDHYYADDQAFALTVRSACAYAKQYPTSLILLGAEAQYPEIEYGWIEPGRAILETADLSLLRVNRFWEKPCLKQAQALMRHGCLWNTFVTIGQAKAFLKLLRAGIPDIVSIFERAVAEDNLDAAYQTAPVVDFSRDVLRRDPQRLLVLRDMASGWADLGNPKRVIDTLVRQRIEPAWMRGLGHVEGVTR
jgi:mannose-1-phosphate guanylyltransferase